VKRAALALLILAAACAVHRPAREGAHPMPSERVRGICRQVESLGRSGDWLVVRGTHPTDDLVSGFTNLPVSHVGVYDKEKGMVIEAEGVGVHASKLPDFVAKTTRLMILRPIWADGGAGEKAVEKARSLVGRPYDYWGIVGLNQPDAFYCSELAIVAYREFIREEDKVPPVVAPGQLYAWGRVVYDSGP